MCDFGICSNTKILKQYFFAVGHHWCYIFFLLPHLAFFTRSKSIKSIQSIPADYGKKAEYKQIILKTFEVHN